MEAEDAFLRALTRLQEAGDGLGPGFHRGGPGKGRPPGVREADVVELNFVKAGAQNITFHIEAVPDPIAAAKEIRKLGCNVGITLRPMTRIEALYPVLDFVDVVLIMSVNPGFSGQKFMPEMLEKARAIKPRMRPDHAVMTPDR